MFNNLFNMDNVFWRGMSKIGDLIILNILMLVCCIPVFTIGASLTAFFTVSLKLVKNEESYIFSGFFKAFKENFKQSTLIWLILLAIGLLLGVDMYLSNQIPGTLGTVLRYVFIFFAVVYSLEFLYVFPLQSKFDNNLKNTIKNAMIMSIAHLPWTLVMLVISAIPAAVFLLLPSVAIYALPVMLLIGFALIGYVNCIFFNKVFVHYIPKENAAASDEEFTVQVEDEDAAEVADDTEVSNEADV